MPGVADCAVFGIPDDEFGEALPAVVQPAPGPASTPTQCGTSWALAWPATRCRAFVTLHDDLPREDTGKIFKRKLREPYWQGVERRV